MIVIQWHHWCRWFHWCHCRHWITNEPMDHHGHHFRYCGYCHRWHQWCHWCHCHQWSTTFVACGSPLAPMAIVATVVAIGSISYEWRTWPPHRHWMSPLVIVCINGAIRVHHHWIVAGCSSLVPLAPMVPCPILSDTFVQKANEIGSSSFSMSPFLVFVQIGKSLIIRKSEWILSRSCTNQCKILSVISTVRNSLFIY